LAAARRQPPPAAAAPAPPAPPQAAELPAQPPALLSSQATWASPPIKSPPAILPDGRIAAVVDKTVTLLDPSNGQPTQKIPTTGTATAGPWVSSLGDTPVLAWSVSNTLHWVRLDDPAQTERSEKLPSSTGLIVGPHGIGWRVNATTIGVLTPTAPLQRTVPADTDVVAITGADVWLSDTLGRSWLANSASSTAPAPASLDGPANTQPLGVIAATPTTVVAAWKSDTGAITYTTHTPGPGIATPTATLPSPRPRVEASALRPDTTRSSNRRTPVTGPWIPIPGGAINTTTRPLVPLPESAGTLDALVADTAWLTRDQTSTAINLTSGTTTSTRRAERPAQPLAAIPAGILVTAKDATTERLYALPRT
ncbi:hypothetical protein CGZ98_06260, partial [Enemella evansiae]|uniref:hypothetical protein n=1 Tax=Enemella evansiae TaxID=2016499 RepID=UPI000BD674F5